MSAILPDLQLLQSIVREAACEVILPRFEIHDFHFKNDGSVVSAVDIAMQERIRSELQTRWPEYAFLGEELDAGHQLDLSNTESQGVWCLDPLDGTSNFVLGLPFFAVSLALLVDAEPCLGVVYDPLRDECFTARRGSGAWLNDQPLPGSQWKAPVAPIIGLVDFKRLSAGVAKRLVAEPPYRSQRNFGAVALEWCWLAAGRGDVYLHGGQKLWDFAAGLLVLQEAGGYAMTLDGEPIFNNSLNKRSAVAALDKDLFGLWINYLEIKTK